MKCSDACGVLVLAGDLDESRGVGVGLRARRPPAFVRPAPQVVQADALLLLLREGHQGDQLEVGRWAAGPCPARSPACRSPAWPVRCPDLRGLRLRPPPRRNADRPPPRRDPPPACGTRPGACRCARAAGRGSRRSRHPPGTRWTWPAGRSATRSPRGTPARGRWPRLRSVAPLAVRDDDRRRPHRDEDGGQGAGHDVEDQAVPCLALGAPAAAAARRRKMGITLNHLQLVFGTGHDRSSTGGEVARTPLNGRGPGPWRCRSPRRRWRAR